MQVRLFMTHLVRK